MITQFDTSSVGAKKSGGGSKILMFAVLAVGGFLVWKYVIKPKMDAKKDEDNN